MPQAVQEQIDGVFGAVMPFAERTLAQYGEMYPFCAYVDAAGDFHPIDGDPGVGDHPTSEQVLEKLYEVAPTVAAGGQIVTFVADVSLEVGDGIRVEIEHRDGFAIGVVVPYTRDADTGELDITVSELYAFPGERRVWPAG